MADTVRLPPVYVPKEQAEEAAEYLRSRALHFKAGLDQPTPVEQLAYVVLLKAGYFQQEGDDN